MRYRPIYRSKVRHSVVQEPKGKIKKKTLPESFKKSIRNSLLVKRTNTPSNMMPDSLFQWT